MSDTLGEMPKTTQIMIGAEGVDFVTPDGRAVLRLRVFPEGTTQLTLLGPTGGSASLIAQPDVTIAQVTPPSPSRRPTESVALMARPGRSVIIAQSEGFQATMTADADVSTVSVGLIGTDTAPGTPIVGMAANVDQGFLSLLNTERVVMLDLRSREDGGQVTVSDGLGGAVVELGAADGDGCLLITDKTGARVMEIPKWKFSDKTRAATEGTASRPEAS